jgi:ribosome recycling factor
MPINQLATVSVPESRLITVQVWDSNNVNLIDSAIRKSNLGVNPQIDGQMLRLPIPNLTEERREELKKSIKGIAEKSKISIRNIRREGKDELKKLLEKKSISEDENKKFEKEIQTITDSSITEIEKILEKKEKEIMSV